MGSTLRDPELDQVDIHQIKRMIPHRYPFLMIDRVFNIKSGESAVGLKNVTVNEPFFEGHFPSRPVMPGVLIVEAMAQAASILVAKTLGLQDHDMLVYFMALEKTRFRKVVEPGDQLELHVRVLRPGGRAWKFAGQGIVDGQTVAEAEFMAMIQADSGDKA